MKNIKTVWTGDRGVSDNVRLLMPANALARLGYPQPKLTTLVYRADVRLDEIPDVDVVIMSRPHYLSMIKQLKDAGIKVLADQDDDFFAIEKNHPGYVGVGSGDPLWLDMHEKSLAEVDGIIVTTEELKKRMSRLNDNIYVIPNGWEKRNKYWDVWFRSSMYTFGFSGTMTHRKDFMECREGLIRVLNRYKNTRVVIAGDPGIYRQLDQVPERQKLFIPPVNFEYYPATLGYFDCLLVPLENTYFNAAKSDIKLVDAGAKGIPFVATPLPAYKDWGKGGLYAETEEEWYECLATLAVNNANDGTWIARQGHEKAMEREIDTLIVKWEEVLEDITDGN